MNPPRQPPSRADRQRARIRAEERRLARGGVRDPGLALQLAVYACRNGASPHERNARRIRREYADRHRPPPGLRTDPYG